MSRRRALLLLFAFAVSVAVRWPLLNRPLSGHHELCTALVLIVLHNWQQDGFIAHHGAPAITFTGPADLIPPSYTDAPALHDGVLYYLSHPPLAFDLSHALFALTGVAPNALGLQLFNLFFHLLTAIGLYLVVRELHPIERESNAPLFASLLYLFMPASLWFHGNVYMSDMFVQNAWVWHVLAVLRMYGHHRPGWHQPLLAGLTLCVTTLISWPGVWAGAALFFIALLRWWRSRSVQELRIMAAAMLGVGLALGYTAWRWMQVVEADALIAYFTGRYAERGSTGLGRSLGDAIGTLLLNYRINWLPLLLPLILLLLNRRHTLVIPQRFRLFVALAGAPLMLEHIFLLEYSLHDFAALKAGLPLCALAGMGLSLFGWRWSSALLIITSLAGVLYFYRTNPIDSASDKRFTWQHEQGEAIAREARPDEMVFTLGFTPEPQVQWYAKRTLFRVNQEERALELMRAAGQRKGVVFREADGELSAIRIAD
ncbi:MAG: hypothetical protein IPM46_08030 [Flavobacteriales bacterium]|nr:hypothetical protein [Flavobacteriales bacterium]